MKEKVDLVVKNGIVITSDPRNTVYENGGVAVRGSKIVEVSKSRTVEERYTAEDVIDAHGQIVMPGLIDTHVHSGQQFLRGNLSYLTKNKNYQIKAPGWKTYLIPFESCLSESDMNLSATATYANMIKVGTTCFAEHGGPHPDEMGKAVTKTGIRGVIAKSTFDMNDEGLPANVRNTTKSAINVNVNLVKNWHNKANGRIHGSLSCRQIIICSLELFKEFARLSKELDVIVETHFAEGAYEIDYCIQHYGKRTTEVLNDIGFLSPRVLAAHSAQLSKNEVRLFKEKDVKVAHCPSGNFAMFGAPKVPYMMEDGIVMGIGSDGGGWGSLDLFKEMKISKTCQLSHFGAPYLDQAFVQDEDLVNMATINGAKAIRWQNDIGSLEVGKKADMIIVGSDSLHTMPCPDPYFAVVNLLTGNDVKTTIIDGKVVMKDKVIQTINEEKLKDGIKERVPKIMEKFSKFW